MSYPLSRPALRAGQTGLLAAVFTLACATAAPAPEPVQAAAPRIVISDDDLYRTKTDEVVVAPSETARLEKRPPPSRKAREYLLAERVYDKLFSSFPMGFTPDDCERLCKASNPRVPSEDGRWVWVLRCLLKRNLHDEPVVACREDATDPARVPTPKASSVAGIER